MNDTIMALVHKAMPVFSSFRDSNVSLLEQCRNGDSSLGGVAGSLAHFIADRQQSATFLIQYGMLWDAEIILRSAAEAVLKLMFICLAEPAERSARVREYLEGLSAAANLQQSERARIKLSVLPSDAQERPVFEALVLTEAQEHAIRQAWPSKVRKVLSAKWSFTEIVQWVDTEMAKRGTPPITQTILHNYGLSSHLIHADVRGVELVQDRYARDKDVRSKLENAHAARLLSDMLAYSAMIGLAVSKTIQDANLTSYLNSYRLFDQWYSREAQRVLSDFYDSQEAFYANLDKSIWTFGR